MLELAYVVVLSTTLSFMPVPALAQPAAVTAYGPESVTGPARWAGRAPIAGLTVACPVAWAGDVVLIAGVGQRVCEDTGRWDVWRAERICPENPDACRPDLDGSPHLDVYVGGGASAWGIQRRMVWRIETLNDER